jgi:DNA-binding transcriptional MocR family regulator
MPFQPIDSKRLYEQVADQIGDMIRRGEFQAGQRLPAERDLEKSVGVSRPVVREAGSPSVLAGASIGASSRQSAFASTMSIRV